MTHKSIPAIIDTGHEESKMKDAKVNWKMLGLGFGVAGLLTALWMTTPAVCANKTGDVPLICVER